MRLTPLFVAVLGLLVAGTASAETCTPRSFPPLQPAQLTGDLSDAAWLTGFDLSQDLPRVMVGFHQRRLRALGRNDPRVYEPLIRASESARGLAIDGNLSKGFRTREARRYLDDAIAGITRAVGPDHPMALSAGLDSARFWVFVGDTARGLAEARAVITRADASVCPTSDVALDAREVEAELVSQTDPAAAVGLWRTVVEGRVRLAGANHLDTVTARERLSLQLEMLNQLAESESVLRQAVDGRAAIARASNNDRNIYAMLQSGLQLTRVVEARGRTDEAQRLLRLLLDLSNQAFPKGNDLADGIQLRLAQAALRSGRPTESIERLDGISALRATGSLRTQVLTLRADALAALGRLDEAERLLAEAVSDWDLVRPRTYDYRAVGERMAYARVLATRNKTEQAERILRDTLTEMEAGPRMAPSRRLVSVQLATLRLAREPAEAEALVGELIGEARAGDPTGVGLSGAMGAWLALRGLARFHQENWSGAYEDADAAVAIFRSRLNSRGAAGGASFETERERVRPIFLLSVQSGWALAHQP